MVTSGLPAGNAHVPDHADQPAAGHEGVEAPRPDRGEFVQEPLVVREVAELILKARGEWQGLLTKYFLERGDVAHGAQRSR